MDPWRQAAQDANAKPLLTMAEQRDLEKRHQQDQREIKRLEQELRRKAKALAEAVALLIASKRSRPTGARRGGLTSPADRRRALEILDGAVASGARARALAALLGVGLTTLQRWRRQFAGDGDGTDRRKGSPRDVAHRLSEEECQRILLTCNQRNLQHCRRARSCRPWGTVALELGHHLPAHQRPWCVALPLCGDRRLEPQGGGLGPGRSGRLPDRRGSCQPGLQFHTLKHRPDYPKRPFRSKDDVCLWVAAFEDWYNHQHRHSAIRFVSPHQRHNGNTAASGDEQLGNLVTSRSLAARERAVDSQMAAN